MGGLTEFLKGDVGISTLRQSRAVKAPASQYIGMVLTKKGKFPDLGGSYTPSGGSATVVMAANILTLQKDLAYQGGAYFFGEGTINGTKDKPTEITEGMTYGRAFKPRPTGEVQETAKFMYKHFYRNIPFFNDLRRNSRGYDVWLYTANSVEKVDSKKNNPVFDAIGHPVTGERENTISGEFEISWNDLNGELVPEFGITIADLDAELMVYNFGTIGSTVNLTQQPGCAGDCITFNRGTNATCGFTRDVTDPKGCGQHYLFYNDNEAFPGGVTGSVNPTTGVISFTALSAGTHRFTHAFENETGIFAYYCFKIVAS